MTKAVGVSVRGARSGSRQLPEFLSRGREPERLVRPISDYPINILSAKENATIISTNKFVAGEGERSVRD